MRPGQLNRRAGHFCSAYTRFAWPKNGLRNGHSAISLFFLAFLFCKLPVCNPAFYTTSIRNSKCGNEDKKGALNTNSARLFYCHQSSAEIPSEISSVLSLTTLQHGL